MLALLDAFEAVRDFMETGGDVLFAILVVTFLMWVLIIERFWYIFTGHPQRVNQVVQTWKARPEVKSWNAHRIKEALVSQVSMDLKQGLMMIKTLVALCPLLGLLGTVTGMVEVFDVMAIVGTGNARAMAAGVSKATIPTMAGMVAALSGLMFSVRLERFAEIESGRVADKLVTEH